MRTIGGRIIKRTKRNGPRPAPELRRQPVSVRLSPAVARQVCAHHKAGLFVERCISLARCITREQDYALTQMALQRGCTVGQIVHEAIVGLRIQSPHN